MRLWLLAAVIAFSVSHSVTATESAGIEQQQEIHSEHAEATVSTTSEFLDALSAGKKLITVNGQITIGSDAVENTGKMLPVVIPAGVTIQGEANGEITCRCPIQLGGDDVILRDLRIVFISTNALGSVPHREIFLAGYGLTLDNVDTYAQGGDDSLGGLGGSEAELLPTIYGGAFEGTQTLGTNASVTIQNANENTKFQAMYMGHGEEADSKVAYTGKATLAIAPKTVVRDGIYVNQNSVSDILVSGSGNLSDVSFVGNDNTTLRVYGTSVNRTEIDGVGTIQLDEAAYFQLLSGALKHVVMENGACLDCNEMTDVSVTGNLSGGVYEGETDTRGILVLNMNGSLSVGGKVTGTTLFCTDNKNYPGEYWDGETYIKVTDKDSPASGFVLPEKMTEFFELSYTEGAWSVTALYDSEIPLVGSVEILSAPKSVDVSKVISEGLIPAPQAPYCEVVWKDENGFAYTSEEVKEYQFYLSDMIIGIRTDDWTSEDSGEQLDWETVIWLVAPEEPDGKYYFYSEHPEYIKTGEYTYLFCSEYFEDLNTVADVKEQLEGKVKACMDVVFYDSSKGDLPPSEPEDDPSGDEPSGDAPSGEDPGTNEGDDSSGENPGTNEGTENIPDAGNGGQSGDTIVTPNPGTSEEASEKEEISIPQEEPEPAPVKLSKLTGKKKSIVVKWNKPISKISGYQIQYSTNKKFTKKTTKTITIKKKKTTSKTIKKLKAKKKYYVRIRTYQTVNVDGKTKKVYSDWSKVKAVKTKR